MIENTEPVPRIPVYGPPVSVLNDPAHQKPLNKMINSMLKSKTKLHSPVKRRTVPRRKKIKYY